MEVDEWNCIHRLLTKWWECKQSRNEKRQLIYFRCRRCPLSAYWFFGWLFYFKEGNLCLSLSSLSRGQAWSGSLILAGSRGHDLWWHINWAVPLKKRKASVTNGPTVFVELWKLVLFGQKALRCLFTHQSVSNGSLLSLLFLYVCLCVSVCMSGCI